MSKIKFTITRGSAPEVDEEMLEKAVRQFKDYMKKHNEDPEAWFMIQDILIAGLLSVGEEGLNMYVNIIFTRKTKEESGRTIMLGGKPVRIEDANEEGKICDELSELQDCCPELIMFSEPEDDHIRNQLFAYVSVKEQ